MPIGKIEFKINKGEVIRWKSTMDHGHSYEIKGKRLCGHNVKNYEIVRMLIDLNF